MAVVRPNVVCRTEYRHGSRPNCTELHARACIIMMTGILVEPVFSSVKKTQKTATIIMFNDLVFSHTTMLGP